MNNINCLETLTDDVIVRLSAKASAKIDRLVLSLPTEVGFYGLVDKIEDSGKFIFNITDILLYPQKVSMATTTTDDLEMASFYMENASRINKIRYHGHSHVSMAAVPSIVDKRHMDGLVSQLKQNKYYIFQIFNKQGQVSSIIFIQGKYYFVECHREIDEELDYGLLR